MTLATQAIQILKNENPNINLAYLEDIATDYEQGNITANECYVELKAFCKGLSAVKAIDAYDALEEITAIHSQTKA